MNSTGQIEAPVPQGRLRATATYLARTALWIPATVAMLLMAPLLLTQRTFGHDWTLHLWLLRQQQLNIEALRHPGLFISTRHLGAFYPAFAFMCSGTYSVGGYLAIAIGDRPILAYKLMYAAGLCFALGGSTWLAHQLGLRGWRSQIPGVVLVTGAYFVTDFVGRGDLGEFMAVSAIPLALAGMGAVVTARTLRPAHLVALVVAIFFATGSHNITMLFGSIFVALIAVVLVVADAPRRPRLPWRRVAVATGACAIGVGLNAWYLVANVAYGLNTQLSRSPVDQRLPSTELSSPSLLLNPFRIADPYPPFWRDLRFAVPWLFLLWTAFVARELWSSTSRTERRAFIGLGLLLVGYLTFITQRAPWKIVPHLLYNVQFTWRLHAYVLLTTTLLVLLALRWLIRTNKSTRRTLSALLVIITVFNVGAAVWQVWRVRSEYVSGRHEVVTGRTFADKVVAARTDEPPSWYPGADYRDASLPVIASAPDRRVTIPVQAIHHSQFAGWLPVPDGPAPFRTNLSSPPHFVRVSGIRIVGRSADGTIVATRAPGVANTGRVMVTIRPNATPLLRAGTAASLLSLAALCALIGWALASAITGSRRRAASVSAVRTARGTWIC